MISIFIFLITISLFAFEKNKFFEKLEPQRISANFYGSISKDNIIFVYGDGGTILKSNDIGNTWEKITVNDSLIIIGMIQNGSSLFGLCSKRWGIISNDNGENWEQVDLGDYNFYQLLTYGDKIVALTERKVIIFDKSYNKINEYTYSTDGNYYKSAILGNKIYCSSGYGSITIINLDNGDRNQLYLSDFGICVNCPVVKNIISAPDDFVLFSLDNFLYRLNVKTSKIDTLTFISNIKFAAFYVQNENVYFIYSRKILSQKDTLFFYRLDYKNKKSYRVNNTATDRYVSDLVFNQVNFINDKILLAVGDKNLIYLSTDGGINWHLKSFLGNFFYINLFDGNQARAIGPYATFYSSSDYGITWLPTKNYHTELYQNYKFYQPIESNGYFQFKDKNNGYVFFPSNTENTINTIFTNDGGQTTIKASKTRHFNEELKTFSIEHNNKYLFAQWGCLPWHLGCWSSFSIFNDNFDFERGNAIRGSMMFYLTKFDNKLYSLSKDTSTPNNIYTVYYTEDDGNSWLKDFNFSIDEPLQTNCVSAILINNSIYATWNKIKITPKDTIQLQSCYQIDLKNKISRKLIETRGESVPAIFKIKEMYFFHTAYLVLENQKISIVSNLFYTNDLNNQQIIWDTVRFSRYSIGPIHQIIGDSLLIFSAYDNITKNSILFFSKVKDNLTSVELETDEQKIKKIYISVPIPNPAKDKVVFNIYWDQKLLIDNCKFYISDILGRTLSINNQIYLNKKNSYSGELIINSSVLPSGVYLLSASISGENFSQVFVVFK